MEQLNTLIKIVVLSTIGLTLSSCKRLEIIGSTASLSVSCSDIDFGAVSIISEREVACNITNNGETAATSFSVSALSGPFRILDMSEMALNVVAPCTSTIQSGETCRIETEFKPSSVGSFSNDPYITYSNGDGVASVSLHFIGEGITPPEADVIFQTVSPLDFGNVSLGSTITHVVTVKNQGDGPATSFGALPMASHFRFAGGTYPGTNGTCGTELDNGTTCDVDLEFAPSVSGALTGTLSLQFNDGLTTTTSSLSLTGSATAPAEAYLGFLSGVLYDMGTDDVNQTLTATLTLKNSGGAAATSLFARGIAAPFSFKGGTYPGVGGDCAGSLGMNASCTVVLQFVSATPGTFNNTLYIDYNNGTSAQTLSLGVLAKATALDPGTMSFSQTSPYDFGSAKVGQTVNATFTINNSGEVNSSGIGATVAAPFQFTGGAFPGTGASCSSTLLAGTSCTVKVTFAPTAGGTFSKNLAVTFNDGSASQTSTLVLQGTGIPLDPGTMSFSQSSPYDFGSAKVGQTVSTTFTINNAGEIPATSVSATLPAPFQFTGGSYPGTSGNCSTTLAASSSCVLAVTFAPTAGGTFSKNLSLSFNNGSGTTTSALNLQGTGVPLDPGTMTFSPSLPQDLGSIKVGQTASATFTLTNSGEIMATSVGATLPSPFQFTGGSYPGTGGNCSTTLAPSASCTVKVTFAPVTAGSYSKNLSMSFNNGSGVTTSLLNLQGTGIALDPGTITFSQSSPVALGSTKVSTEVSTTLTVSNNGEVNATGIGASIEAPYKFVGGTYPGTGGTCATALAPSASCTIKVAFAPTAAGTFNKNLGVSFNNGTVTQTTNLTLNGTGIALDPSTLTFSQGSPYDMGTSSLDSSTNATFTVSNSGEVSATSISASLSAPYSFTGGTYPGTGANCGTTLTAGSICTMKVSFTPTTGGTFNNNLNLSFNNGSGTTTSTLALTGVGTPGGLADSTFGSSGLVEIDYSVHDNTKSLMIQSSGKIVVAGDERAMTGNEDFSLFQLNTNGSVDTAFASSGHLYHDLGTNSLDVVYNATLQNDGKIVVAGVRNSNIATVRYNANGTLDSSYDFLGLSGLLTSLLTSAAGYGVSVDATGNIVVVGQSFPLLTDSTSFAFRSNSMGGLDLLNFGVTGLLSYDFSSTGEDAFNSVKHDSSSRIVTGGYREISLVKRAMVSRMTAAGVLDTSFATSGVFSTDLSGAGRASEVASLYVQSDDKIIAVGYVTNATNTDLLVFRLNPAGTLDTSFGTGGVVKVDIAAGNDKATAVAVDGSGRVVVVGNYKDGTEEGIAMVRLTSAGVLDSKFGTSGVSKFKINGSTTIANDVKIQTDGKIVIGGTKYTGSTSNYIVLRRTP